MEKLERDTEVGTLTTMPISVVSFPLTSNVLSSTKFMNWSKPRRTPTTFRLAFNFTATISSDRFRDMEDSERYFQEQHLKLAISKQHVILAFPLMTARSSSSFRASKEAVCKTEWWIVWEVTIRLHPVIKSAVSENFHLSLSASHESDEHENELGWD